MEQYLTIAKIVKPQGIRGELKVFTLTDSPEDLKAFDRVYVGDKQYKMLKVRTQGGDCAFITLAGVADRNTAETLRDMPVLALKSEAPELPSGRYYIVDLIGLTALDDGGKVLGRVAQITPARTDVYEIEKPDGGYITFPAVTGVITSVNLQGGEITFSRKKLAEVALEGK